LPSVNALYGELRDKGLEVLLVSFREDPGLVRRTARERGYVAPVLLDQSGEVTGKVYGVWGTPTSYLIDRQGRLVGRVLGPRPWESPAARKLLLDLLGAAPK
jgi:peroxiredoxin